MKNVIVGSGITIPPVFGDPRRRFSLPERYLLYVGRIDRNKGVDRLVRDYRTLSAERELPPLVLVGKNILEIKEDSSVRTLGYVTEEEKAALIASCEILLMPSPFESLSIILLEAWALARPVLANGVCRVLEGQCIRSGGGLYYRGYSEFAATLLCLLDRQDLRESLGRAGRAYVQRECDWDVVERRTLEFLEDLTKGGAGGAGAANQP